MRSEEVEAPPDLSTQLFVPNRDSSPKVMLRSDHSQENIWRRLEVS